MALHKAMWMDNRAKTIAFCALAVLVAASIGVLVAARPAYAIPLTVNSTVDPGTGGCNSTECTLREAINVSNGLSTTETIIFDIPDDPNVAGLEVKTISPTSPLPLITDNVTIDGYTQGGAVVNTATTNANNADLKIELNGTGTDANTSGLVVTGAGAGGTRIKGLVINRFGNHGVFINAPNTFIEGNFIGTNAAGDADLGNSGAGVVLQSSSGSLVGGPANAAQNVISGNGATGVTVAGTSATGNVISNNHIGTDADAGEDLGNSLSGVNVLAPGVIVGGDGTNGAGKDVGAAQGEGNIISGNNQHGVLIDNIGASGAKVQGNFIGVNLNGNGFSDIGNTLDGVRISSAPQAEIGGTGATFSNGQGNTISDNGQHGVEIAGSSSTNNKVLGNHIGTDFNGSSDFGNTLDGVRIGNSSNTTIGGTVAGARNVISGNEANGVFISGTSSATFNKVEGNFIGTDVNGASDLGNAEVGVRVETPGNFVGGTASGARNVISGNAGVGVSMLGAGASGNTVQGNLIGTQADGTTPLPNFHGVFISEASRNTIGGTVSGAGNTVSGNANNGVFIIDSTSTGNRILRNSIFNNGTPGGLGIDLKGGDEATFGPGVTKNDPKDPDTGPNKLQNFPVITSASATKITGKLNSRPGRSFTIQFFSNPQPNFPTGFGEGQTFLGQKTVRTNDRGKVSVAFTTTVSADQVITATATDSAGNTSEFSQSVPVS